MTKTLAAASARTLNYDRDAVDGRYQLLWQLIGNAQTKHRTTWDDYKKEHQSSGAITHFRPPSRPGGKGEIISIWNSDSHNTASTTLGVLSNLAASSVTDAQHEPFGYANYSLRSAGVLNWATMSRQEKSRYNGGLVSLILGAYVAEQSMYDV